MIAHDFKNETGGIRCDVRIYVEHSHLIGVRYRKRCNGYEDDHEGYTPVAPEGAERTDDLMTCTLTIRDLEALIDERAEKAIRRFVIVGAQEF